MTSMHRNFPLYRWQVQHRVFLIVICTAHNTRPQYQYGLLRDRDEIGTRSASCACWVMSFSAMDCEHGICIIDDVFTKVYKISTGAACTRKTLLMPLRCKFKVRTPCGTRWNAPPKATACPHAGFCKIRHADMLSCALTRGTRAENGTSNLINFRTASKKKNFWKKLQRN